MNPFHLPAASNGGGLKVPVCRSAGVPVGVMGGEVMDLLKRVGWLKRVGDVRG